MKGSKGNGSLTDNKLYRAVCEIPLADVRKSISKECYKRKMLPTFFWFIFDLVFFIGAMLLVFLTSSVWLQILGGLLAGVATSMMFIWAHDAAHGTLFKSKNLSEVLGTLFMLPSLNMFRLWVYGHNKVHHGFTSFSEIDWIWRPLTMDEYKKLSAWERFLYRIERNMFFVAFHYLRKVWYGEMLKFNPGKPTNKSHNRSYYLNSKLFVLAYAVLMAVLGYFFAGGVIGIICALVIPFIVFNYYIAFVVYLNHTHPDVPFFIDRKQWTHTVGMVYCSVTVQCGRLGKILLHNIMTHTPHHVDIRIPFYNLDRAYADISSQYGQYLTKYPFSWKTIHGIFKACKVYDFENHKWLSFKEAEKQRS